MKSESHLALVIAFLAVENKIWQLEDLPIAYLVVNGSRFRLSIRKKSGNDNCVN